MEEKRLEETGKVEKGSGGFFRSDIIAAYGNNPKTLGLY